MQEVIVMLVVVCAAGFVTVRYAPKTILRAVGGFAVRKARRAGWTGIASGMEKVLLKADCAGACGSCGSCASDAPTTQAGVTVEVLRSTARRQPVRY